MRFKTRDLTANLADVLVVDCVQQNTGCGDASTQIEEVPCEGDSQPPCQDQSQPPPPCERDSQAPEISGCNNSVPCNAKSKAHGGGARGATKRAIRAQMARARARTLPGKGRDARR